MFINIGNDLVLFLQILVSLALEFELETGVYLFLALFSLGPRKFNEICEEIDIWLEWMLLLSFFVSPLFSVKM